MISNFLYGLCGFYWEHCITQTRIVLCCSTNKTTVWWLHVHSVMSQSHRVPCGTWSLPATFAVGLRPTLLAPPSSTHFCSQGKEVQSGTVLFCVLTQKWPSHQLIGQTCDRRPVSCKALGNAASRARKRTGNNGEHLALLTTTVHGAGTADYSAFSGVTFLCSSSGWIWAGLSFGNKNDISQPPLQSGVVRSLIVKKW